MSRVTIEDVARRAGVSVATVSRALRGLPNVAPSTRDKVNRVAGELDYRAHPHASRLATGRTQTIGMAVPILNTWYFSTVIAGAEAVLSDHGYDVLLVNIDSEDKRRRVLASSSSFANRVDGLILVDVRLPDDEAERLAAAGSRVVTVGHRAADFPSVVIDNQLGAAIATRHLVSLGHREIGLIWAPTETSLHFSVPFERRQGYLRVLAEHDLVPSPDLQVAGDFSVDGGAEAMVALLGRSRPPTAVFAISDEMAFGAVRAARDRGRRVPDDVSVIGFDDHELAEVMRLTTIRQPVVDHGVAAARALLRLLERDVEGATTPQHLVHSTSLVVRDTTGPRLRG